MSRRDDVSDALRPLAPGECRCYLSASAQVADILERALEFTGPADVLLSSFSISEEFLRRLFFIREGGAVRSLEIVLDFKATHKTLLLWPFLARTVERCRLADNHSKVLVVANESHRVAAVMSQNLTRGNRFEAGVLFADLPAAGPLEAALRNVIDNHSISFEDVYSGRIGAH